jgi:hypothetical protein
MDELPIRKTVSITEEISSEGAREVDDPITKSAAIAVLENPYAGVWEEDLSLLTEWSVPLGRELTASAVARVGGMDAVEGYGKAGVVGLDGEREHAAAILHPKLGGPMRDAVGGGEAIIPSTKKMGPPGAAIDVPTHFKDDEWVASHWDAMTVSVPDAPRADELAIAIVVTDGGRPHPRTGDD